MLKTWKDSEGNKLPQLLFTGDTMELQEMVAELLGELAKVNVKKRVNGEEISSEWEYYCNGYEKALYSLMEMYTQNVPQIEEKSNRVPKNSPIWELKNFEKYSTPRKYDPVRETWSTINKTKGRELHLPIHTLIEVIILHQKGASEREIFEKVPNRLRSSSGIKTWIYMYRAGAFNEGIKKYASDYGYNAEALISKECDGMETTSHSTQRLLI